MWYLSALAHRSPFPCRDDAASAQEGAAGEGRGAQAQDGLLLYAQPAGKVRRGCQEECASLHPLPASPSQTDAAETRTNLAVDQIDDLELLTPPSPLPMLLKLPPKAPLSSLPALPSVPVRSLLPALLKPTSRSFLPLLPLLNLVRSWTRSQMRYSVCRRMRRPIASTPSYAASASPTTASS